MLIGRTFQLLVASLAVAIPLVSPGIGRSEITADPLDEPLRLIAEARKAIQEVRDYHCVLVKRERVNGRLMPEEMISLKVRHQPFSVSMRWLAPSDQAGKEVCYVAGHHGNKMRVHPNGGLGLVGWVTIDPKDPRALKTTRHSIAEAGLANLIDSYAAGWQAERRSGHTRVEIADCLFDQRRCTRVEVAHPANTVGLNDFYRTVVIFDRDSKLPVRVECYDYPRHPDDPGELLEAFSYTDVRPNIGLGNETFNH